MAQTAWDTERVRQLLVKAREFTVVARGRILGAKLGKLLRNFDRDFYPGVLGDKKLVSLLRRYPDLGTIEIAAQDFVFQFFLDGAESARPADATGSDTPKAATSVTASQADSSPEEQGALPGIEPANTWIDHALWFALVAEHAAAVHVDLQTLSLVSARDGALPQLQSEPERFVRVPPIPQDDLRQIAREFATSQADSTTRETLESTLSGVSWFRDFTERANQLGISEKWLSQHRSFVIGRARQWFVEHGIKPDRFIKGRSRVAPRRDTEGPVTAAPPAKSLGGIRRIVHSAIDRMSDDELLNLSIPLRHLFPK